MTICLILILKKSLIPFSLLNISLSNQLAPSQVISPGILKVSITRNTSHWIYLFFRDKFLYSHQLKCFWGGPFVLLSNFLCFGIFIFHAYNLKQMLLKLWVVLAWWCGGLYLASIEQFCYLLHCNQQPCYKLQQSTNKVFLMHAQVLCPPTTTSICFYFSTVTIKRNGTGFGGKRLKKREL